MKKRRIVLLALLVLVLAVTCALAVACNKKATVTLSLDSNVTSVTIDGTEYKDKDTVQIAKGTEVSFTVKCKTGYEPNIVRVGSKTVKTSKGEGKFTVTEDATLSVTTKIILNGISVELADENKVFYAGQKVDAKDIVVTAQYATGTSSEVVGTVTYQNGDAFALGDTQFTVTYLNKTIDVELDYEVVGLITLNLNGGTLTNEQIKALDENAVLKDGAVTWTFDEPIETAIQLPEPKLLLGDTEVELPFKQWSGTGVKDNAIEPTSVSVVAAATYNTNLVNVTKMYFELDEDVPYLVIEGEFDVATTAYLYFYEGQVEIQYDPGLTATKQGDDNSFELRMNLAEMVKTDPEYVGKGDKPEDLSFVGPWMDIRFVVQIGETKIQQELFLTEDSDFADVGDQVVAKVEKGEETKYYRFFFGSWTPKKGDEITGTNGAQFEGTEKILKLRIEETQPYRVDDVALEQGTDEDAETVYLVISGTYLDEADDEEAFKRILEAIFADLQNNDGANHNGWGMYLNNGDGIVKIVNFNKAGNSTFKIYLSLAALEDGDVAFAHFGASNKNLEKTVTESSVKVGTKTYTMKNWTGWDSQLVCVFVDDSAAKAISLTGADLKVEGDKLLYIISGTYKNYTEAELKALQIFWDLQVNDNIFGGGWDRLNEFEVIMSVNEAERTFAYTIDISSLITTKRAYTAHFGYTVNEKDEPMDFKPDCDSFEMSVEYKGFTVSLIYVKGSGSDKEFWGCVGIKVVDAEYTVTSVELAEQDDKAVMIIKGTVEGYKEGAKVYMATVLNGGSYDTVERTAYVTITVDAEGNFTATWDLTSTGLAAGSYWIHFSGASVDLPANKVNTEKATITVNGVKYSLIGVEAEKTNSPEILVEEVGD